MQIPRVHIPLFYLPSKPSGLNAGCALFSAGLALYIGVTAVRTPKACRSNQWKWSAGALVLNIFSPLISAVAQLIILAKSPYNLSLKTLKKAVQEGDLKAVKWLFEESSLVIDDENGVQIPKQAVAKAFSLQAQDSRLKSSLEVVQYFAEKGCDFTTEIDPGSYEPYQANTALHLAAIHNLPDLASAVLLNPQNHVLIKTLEPTNHRTPLHVAADSGSLEMVQLLTSTEAAPSQVNIQDARGQTPLHLAVAKRQLAIVRYLLQTPGLGVDPNLKNASNRTPFEYAAELGGLERVQCFFESVGDFTPKVDTGELLHLATLPEDSVSILTYLIEEKNWDPNALDAEGQTALHWAAKNYREEAFAYLMGKVFDDTKTIRDGEDKAWSDLASSDFISWAKAQGYEIPPAAVRQAAPVASSSPDESDEDPI